MNVYLMDEASVTTEMIAEGVRRPTSRAPCTQVLCGSAIKNKGIQPLLDAIVACPLRLTAAR